MKVSIIGGGGLVGSCTGFALQTGKVVREIALLDVNADLVAGQALDLLHGASVSADQVITSGSYEHVPSSDVICITAGLRRKPDESRLDLVNRNVDLFVGILNEVSRAGVKRDAVVVVVSNPVDVLTYLAATAFGFAHESGNRPGNAARHDPLPQLDCPAAGRAADAGQSPDPGRARRQHGADLVQRDGGRLAAWKGFPAGTPIWPPNCSPRTKGSGAEVISKKKGGAGFAVGLAIQEVIEAIALDRQAILPVSSVQNGCYGIRDVALSVPTVVGPKGLVPLTRSNYGPRKPRPCATAARCCVNRSTPFWPG